MKRPAEDSVTYISTDSDFITLINVFTVEPASQDELALLLQEATEQAIRHLPGFISANIHKSLDGKRVVNYAQWKSKEDMEAMLRNPDAGSHIQAAYKIAQVDPHLYKVESQSITSRICKKGLSPCMRVHCASAGAFHSHVEL